MRAGSDAEGSLQNVLLFPMPLAVNESWVVELVLLDSIVHLQ